MQRDVLNMNMELQLTELAAERFGKLLEECTEQELFHILQAYCKRLLAVTERNSGEKKVYYISSEFMLGRLLINNLINLKIYDRMEAIMAKYGKNLADIEQAEPEPSLGSTGLGRLAACYMDSIATLKLPAEGIGMNYHYGLFRQVLEDHRQRELPDPWMKSNGWEEETDVTFDVWFGRRKVTSRMYDIDVVGYDAGVNRLRLFDVADTDESLVKDGIRFDRTAIEKNLSLFLSPDDTDEDGKLLRLCQQYFMVSNAAQWILREMKAKKFDLRHFEDHAVIQINDTHPALIIPELIRILTQQKAMPMDEAIEVVSKSCAYTNHTVSEEAMEVWPLEYLSSMIPQLVPIIRELDRRVKKHHNDPAVFILDEENRVHMVNLCVHYSFSVNGVSAVHTHFLKTDTLKPLYDMYPGKFSNKTNGITFRRWLLECNHPLANYLSERISDAYKWDSLQLERLLEYADDPEVLSRLEEIKRINKQILCDMIVQKEHVQLDPDGIFDMQLKTVQEYRRHLLNALYIIHRYLEIKAGKVPARPLNVIIGGKAEPASVEAGDIIHLLLVLQDIINHDPAAAPWIKVVYVSNYNVSYAERLIPACDISEQISLASRESAGTANMKFMLNGAVTLGTEDGTNIEIHELTGSQNMYLFGLDAVAVLEIMRSGSYNPLDYYERNQQIREAADFIVSDQCLCAGDPEILRRLHERLCRQDSSMCLIDFEDYVRVKDRMIGDYEDRQGWNQKNLINIARAGFFSSDRVVMDYNRDIWKLQRTL